MSGHSKWSTIKHKKAATDKKRSAVFAKLAKAITIAANQGGGDPETNYALRSEIDRAKSFNLPKDKIEQAVKRGTGESKEGVQLVELLIEGLGPGGSAILIEAITDNRNRTTAEVRHILNQNHGKMAGEGSVQWQFARYGVLRIQEVLTKNKEEFELLAIEEGAEDIKNMGGSFYIYTNVDNTQKMLEYMQKQGYDELEASLEWIPKNTVEISEKENSQLEKLFEALDEQDDVQDIYTNTE
ncbi:MAG: YebC/PmpR family DNA-binding transcriptional regulator [Candidatus Spechtbacterales bacterium]